MTRRELLQKTTLAFGYSLSAPTLLAILQSCDPKHQPAYKPVFFNSLQATVIGDLADLIIPRTTTPGAKDVGVPAFIDSFVKEVFSKDEKAKFIKDIDEFEQGTVGRHFRTFSDCFPDIQRIYAQYVHQAAIRAAAAVSEGWWNSNQLERPFILKMKELTLLGYFSSEVGATQVLQYNQSPGPFQGCVPLSQVGKAWAT